MDCVHHRNAGPNVVMVAPLDRGGIVVRAFRVQVRSNSDLVQKRSYYDVPFISRPRDLGDLRGVIGESADDVS